MIMRGALVWCPFGDEASARACAAQLLDEGLIACANLLPAMASLYVWQGELDEASECGALLKTSEALLESAIARLEELHPYASPAIIGWVCEQSGAATGAWLGELEAGKKR